MEHVDQLVTIFGYGSFAFVVFVLATPFFYKLLLHWKLGKQLREEAASGGVAQIFRSLHKEKEGTPTMGGVLIWGSILMTVLFSRILSLTGLVEKSLLGRGQVYLPLFTLISMGILGAIDDWLNIRGVGKEKGMSVAPKFLITTIFAAMGAWWFFYKLGYNSIHIPRLGDFVIGWWYIPLFILVIVGTANAVNITDGLDGLAGGLLIIAYGALAAIAYAKGLIILCTFCGVVCAALIAFLWFNVPKALFYMGDTGSLALGATLGVIAMMIDSLAVLPLIGFVFVIETLSVIVQVASKKLRNGKKVFAIAPLHHHLEHLGWGEAKVVMRLWIVGFFFAVVGLIIGLIGMGDLV